MGVGSTHPALQPCRWTRLGVAGAPEVGDVRRARVAVALGVSPENLDKCRILALAPCQAREGAAQCAHRSAGSSTKHPLRGRNAGIRRAWTLHHGRARQPSGRTRATPRGPGGGAYAAPASMNGHRVLGCRPSESRASPHRERPRRPPLQHPLPKFLPSQPGRGARCGESRRRARPPRTMSAPVHPTTTLQMPKPERE